VIQRLDFLYPEANSVRWVEGDTYAKNLRRFAELGREHGFKLLFVDYPLRAIERGESPGDEGRIVGYAMLGAPGLAELHALHETGQEIARRVATREGVRWVETESALRASPEPPFSDFDLVHPNEFGARIIGRVLFETLVELGWLNPATPPGPDANPAH